VPGQIVETGTTNPDIFLTGFRLDHQVQRTTADINAKRRTVVNRAGIIDVVWIIKPEIQADVDSRRAIPLAGRGQCGVVASTVQL
jgi:hypothetical protein